MKKKMKTYKEVTDAYELIDEKAANYSYDVWTYDIALD